VTAPAVVGEVEWCGHVCPRCLAEGEVYHWTHVRVVGRPCPMDHEADCLDHRLADMGLKARERAAA